MKGNAWGWRGRESEARVLWVAHRWESEHIGMKMALHGNLGSSGVVGLIDDLDRYPTSFDA